jgi:hypothetical protein
LQRNLRLTPEMKTTQAEVETLLGQPWRTAS